MTIGPRPMASGDHASTPVLKRASSAWWPVAAVALIFAATPPWAAHTVDPAGDGSGGAVVRAPPAPAADWQVKKPAAGQAFTLRTTRLRSAINTSSSIGDGSRVAWQVYRVNGRLTASDARAKAYAAFDKLLGRGDDGVAIVVSTEDDRKGVADAVLERFLHDHFPAIEAQLQRASASASL